MSADDTHNICSCHCCNVYMVLHIQHIHLPVIDFYMLHIRALTCVQWKVKALYVPFQLFEWCSRQELDKAIQDTPSYPIISHTVDTHYSVTEQMSDAQQAQLQQLIDGMGINLTVTEQTGRIHGIVALKCQTLQDGIFSIRTTDIVESDREEFSLVLQLLAVNDPDTQRTSHFALHHMLQNITAEDDDGRFASFILSADGPSVSHVNRLSVTKPLIYSAVDGMFTIINLFPL